MSVCATIYVWKLTKELVTPSEKFVLLSMADRANENHECWPSKVRLSLDTTLDLKTVKKSISSLVEKGILVDTGERKGSLKRIVVYKIIGVEGREDNEAKFNRPKNGSIKKDDEIFESNRPKNGTINRPKNGTINRPKNGSLNLSVEPIIGTYQFSIGDSANTPRESDSILSKPKKSKPSKDYKKNALFMKFYENYPKKVKPNDAYKAFLKLKPDNSMVDMIIADTLKRHAKDDHWQEVQFIPYPASYLNSRQWEGEICNSEAEKANKKAVAKKISEDNLARIEKASLEASNKPFVVTKEAIVAKKILDKVTNGISPWQIVLKSAKGKQ